MAEVNESIFDGKTFNIERKHDDLMKTFIPDGKRTDLANGAIQRELDREREKSERRRILQSLGELEKKRESMPKPPVKSEDIVRELREGSINGKREAAVNQTDDG